MAEYFWSDRFKSVLVENGETLINCLAYVDLNPVRAGIVNIPDNYRWSSIGYHQQTGNNDGFLSLNFGLIDNERLSIKQRFAKYWQFVYEVASLQTIKGKSIDKQVFNEEKNKDFMPNSTDKFLARTRYFIDSGIIGSKEFVIGLWQKLKSEEGNPDKSPVRIPGLSSQYSLKRLREQQYV